MVRKACLSIQTICALQYCGFPTLFILRVDVHFCEPISLLGIFIPATIPVIYANLQLAIAYVKNAQSQSW